MRHALTGLVLLYLGLGLGAAAQEFHVDFDFSLALDPATSTISDLDVESDVSVSWDFFTLGCELDFEEIGLTWVHGYGGFDVGVAGLSWDGLFGAVNVAFLYGLVTGRVTFGGADFYLYYVMADPDVDGVFEMGGAFLAVASLPGGAKMESLTMFGADLEGISFSQLGVEKEFEFTVRPQPGLSAALQFTGQLLTFTGLGFGCATLDSETYFSKDAGFEYQLFTFHICTPWALNFDVEVMFTVQTKSVTVTPYFDFQYGCIYIYSEVDIQTPIYITGVNIYGIKIVAEFGPVTVEELISFDEVNHDLVLDPYWERFSVEVRQPACCGGYARFRVDTYFEEGSLNIFDWGRTDFRLEVPVSEAFKVWTEMAIDPTGLQELIFGFRFTW